MRKTRHIANYEKVRWWDGLRRVGGGLKVGAVTAIVAAAQLLNAQSVLTPRNLAVGFHLEGAATVTFDSPAPEAGLDITLRSSDPARLRIAKGPEAAGEASLVIHMRDGFRETPEFWLQALGDSGEVTYSAEAPGFDKGIGKVTLTPSAIILKAPIGAASFLTTTGADPTRIMLSSVRLDSSLAFAEEQSIAGGQSASIDITNSAPAVGVISLSKLELPGGRGSVPLMFEPGSEGETIIAVKTPAGYSKPEGFGSVKALVRKPGLAVSNQLAIGQNLQVGGVLSLGQRAPEDGLKVTLSSEDPAKLLLSNSATAVGSKSITISVPAGGTSATYYMQALGGSGTVSYTASAPGYRQRTADIGLAPAGLVITPAAQGPPDEAHVLRTIAPESKERLMIHKSEGNPAKLIVWTAQLDPVTHRCADITVQPLRAGLSLDVKLTNSKPETGTILSDLRIEGGSDHGFVEFKPVQAGSTEISVLPALDFTPSANSTTVIAFVRD